MDVTTRASRRPRTCIFSTGDTDDLRLVDKIITVAAYDPQKHDPEKHPGESNVSERYPGESNDPAIESFSSETFNGRIDSEEPTTIEQPQVVTINDTILDI
jgi:hypothetical protein